MVRVRQHQLWDTAEELVMAMGFISFTVTMWCLFRERCAV
jgi:hypothetical protein